MGGSAWDSFQSALKAYIKDMSLQLKYNESIIVILYINSIHFTILICDDIVANLHSGEMPHLCETRHAKTHFL